MLVRWTHPRLVCFWDNSVVRADVYSTGGRTMSKKSGKTGVSRRDFLTGAAVGTGAVAFAGLGSAPAHAQGPVPSKWDQEADVVIVGFGGAGACAAIEAHDAGAKVVLLEKQPKETHYSNTRMAGGIFHSPDPTGDKAALKEYAKAMFSGENIPWKLEGEQPPEISDGLAEAWAQYSPENVPFLRKLDPDMKFVAAGGAAFPQFPGAQDAKYRTYFTTYTGKADLTVPTKDAPKSQKMNGEAFFACLVESCGQHLAELQPGRCRLGRQGTQSDQPVRSRALADIPRRPLSAILRDSLTPLSTQFRHAPRRCSWPQFPGRLHRREQPPRPEKRGALVLRERSDAAGTLSDTFADDCRCLGPRCRSRQVGPC